MEKPTKLLTWKTTVWRGKQSFTGVPKEGLFPATGFPVYKIKTRELPSSGLTVYRLIYPSKYNRGVVLPTVFNSYRTAQRIADWHFAYWLQDRFVSSETCNVT